GDAACEQRFTGSGGAHEQNAFGDTSSKSGEFFRFTQEVDDLLEFFFGFLYASDIVEGDAVLVFVQQACFGFTEAHRLAAARLQLTHKEEEKQDDKQQWKHAGEEGLPQALFLFFEGELDVVGRHHILKIVGYTSDGLKFGGFTEVARFGTFFGERAFDAAVTKNGDIFDVALFHGVTEIREREFVGRIW